MGYSASEVAHALDLRRVSADQCVTRGKEILDKDKNLRKKFMNYLNYQRPPLPHK